MTPLPTTIPAARGRQAGRHTRTQQGSVTILALALLLGLLALVGLLVEVGSALVAHRGLLDTADAAARAGATALDLDRYRATGGRVAQLDPQLAEQTARTHLRHVGYTGLATVTASPTSITVVLRREHPPLIVGIVPPVRLTATAAAQPQTGITRQESQP